MYQYSHFFLIFQILKLLISHHFEFLFENQFITFKENEAT